MSRQVINAGHHTLHTINQCCLMIDATLIGCCTTVCHHVIPPPRLKSLLILSFFVIVFSLSSNSESQADAQVCSQGDGSTLHRGAQVIHQFADGQFGVAARQQRLGRLALRFATLQTLQRQRVRLKSTYSFILSRHHKYYITLEIVVVYLTVAR